MSHAPPDRRYLLLTAIGTALGAAGATHAGAPPLVAYLLGVNASAFGLYLLDKALAKWGAGWPRVPERVLLLTVALGGLVGAFLGRVVARHKTRKASFRAWFWVVAVVTYGSLAWALVRLR